MKRIQIPINILPSEVPRTKNQSNLKFKLSLLFFINITKSIQIQSLEDCYEQSQT